ncbi:MAG: bifunctional metallophosphatase/5'-nucleotidase [Gaiellaceae bacterium]
MRRVGVLVAVTVGLLLAFLPSATAGNGPKSGDLHVQLLAFNDFHGNLEPPTGSSGRITIGPGGATVNAGGMEYFATWVERLAQANPNTLVVSAGDNIGASPLLSGLFHDEPTILALNDIGTRYSAVGNHEFDEGVAELLRMQNGGCGPEFSCIDGTTFPGASFGYLTSNVFHTGTNDTLFPSAAVVKIGNAKIGFIGATLQGTPQIVTPAGVAGVEFRPEAQAINTVAHELRDNQGVKAFVVLLHQGGGQNPPYTLGYQSINRCDNFSGDVTSIIDQLDPLIGVVVTGHTHNAYVCTIDGKLVTAAASFGRLITDIDLTIDHQSKQITEAIATNDIVTRDVPKDPAITALMNHYLPYEAPIANRVVGSITADLVRTANAAGEEPLGDVIGDAQLADTAPAAYGGAVVAFTNPGGIRADLVGVGPVTYSQLYNVQPFNNVMNVETLTGAQIYAALEQQWSGLNASAPKVLQVSHGFTYTWDASKPAGSRIVAGSVAINGVPVTAIGLYRVALNNFLAAGGDNFPAFAGGTDLIGGDIDLDAFVKYFQTNSPISPPPLNRITRLN